MEKKTKAELYEELKAIVNTCVDEDDRGSKAELIDFCDKELAMLEKRKTDAKARAEKKKEESDVLTAEIYATLTDEPKTVDDILVALDTEDVTRNKITARLGKLIKTGAVEKEVLKVDGNRKMAYRLADKNGAEEGE